jgi:DNA-binding winged helix-turn-helix (wHTH) protein
MGRRVKFGPFELDRQTGELWKHSVKVKLQSKPFQVLVALLDRPGEPVSREDLQKRLWSGNTFVDFESRLNTAANRLRLTLGDSAEKPRYIETLE